MKERPILMNGPMVRATLDGSKTQTRRLIKNTGLYALDAAYHGAEVAERERIALAKHCPHGQPGDRLWVRESGIINKDVGLFRHDVPATKELGHYWVEKTRAPGASYNVKGCSRSSALLTRGSKVCPSIHMPRWACRIELEIVSVRGERLQDISEADILAEGIDTEKLAESQERYDIVLAGSGADGRATIRSAWRDLWESTGGDWNSNPWLWAIEFKLVTP